MSEPLRQLIGSSRALQAVRDAVAQVAATNATVLILGETGTGKELVARDDSFTQIPRHILQALAAHD